MAEGAFDGRLVGFAEGALVAKQRVVSDLSVT
jgi:hypothetical protein